MPKPIYKDKFKTNKTKVTRVKKGASAQKKRTKLEVGRVVTKWFWRVVFYIFLPGVFFLGAAYLVVQVDWQVISQKIASKTKKPVKNISIKGQFEYIEKEKVQAIISQALKGDFVDLDLTDLKNNMQASAWIQEVNLKRVWPDALIVEVLEQKPIARWGSKGFINRYGELVMVELHGKLDALPLLSGDEVHSDVMARVYLDMAILLSRYDLKINELHVDDTRAWKLNIANGPELVFGQVDLTGKLQRFLDVYETHLKKHYTMLNRVDLRYENGLAVQWNHLGVTLEQTE